MGLDSIGRRGDKEIETARLNTQHAPRARPPVSVTAVDGPTALRSGGILGVLPVAMLHPRVDMRAS